MNQITHYLDPTLPYHFGQNESFSKKGIAFFSNLLFYLKILAKLLFSYASMTFDNELKMS